jgi:uridine kinase
MISGGSIVLIAIVGGSGAGKTWLTRGLQRVLAEKAAALSLDDFYRDHSGLPPSRREKLNYDHPRQIDWPLVAEVLDACRAGKPVRLPRYNFNTHTRTDEGPPWQPKPVIIMEGLWLLVRPAVRRRFSLKIFVDSPERVRLRRRIGRDMAERGRSAPSVRRQFFDTVVPMHERYVAPQVRWADVKLSQPLRQPDVDQLADALWKCLGNSAIYPIWMRETFRSELRTVLGSNPRHHV